MQLKLHHVNYSTKDVGAVAEFYRSLFNMKPVSGYQDARITSQGYDGKVEPLLNDKDVFGDGSVIVLNTPGHTPGHHSVLIKLAQTGPVLISGDAVHFHENYDTNGAPWFNFDRAQTLASIDRMKKIAANAKATVIIQHDARDIDKLPAFPTAAK